VEEIISYTGYLRKVEAGKFFIVVEEVTPRLMKTG